jgi:hypothetical protein
MFTTRRYDDDSVCCRWLVNMSTLTAEIARAFKMLYCLTQAPLRRVKVTPWHSYAGIAGRRRYGYQHQSPAAALPRTTRYLIVQGLGGPRGRSGRARTLPGFGPKTAELWTGRYTDCAIPIASTSERASIKVVELVGKPSVLYDWKNPGYSRRGKFQNFPVSCYIKWSESFTVLV